ncbi:MAG: TetR family transcriptional regulator C-terminal domain-containing protein [Rubellimicrobium sp.]|nr:TetR family transcriptional regulator C-terminal domain-containing protein [Rubellimicrobium sp.]
MPWGQTGTAQAGGGRHELIQATLDCIAEQGAHAATVREIARRAGVSPGLIRHHFQTKEHLLEEAYRATMGRMTALSREARDRAGGRPRDRLRRYVAASLAPPVRDANALTLWASFIAMIRLNPSMEAIHRETYLEYRHDIEALLADTLAAAGRRVRGDDLRLMAIKINAVIDGLWLEGSLDPDGFDDDDLLAAALQAIGAILGLPLGGGGGPGAGMETD